MLHPIRELGTSPELQVQLSTPTPTAASVTWRLGVMLNDDGMGDPIWGGANSDLGAFDGYSNLTRYDTIVKYTFVGDLFLEGMVTPGDLELINGDIGQVPGNTSPLDQSWQSGDFLYQSADGIPINQTDYDLASAAFNAQNSYPFFVGASAAWNFNGDGGYSNTANWSPTGVPNGNGVTAILGNGRQTTITPNPSIVNVTIDGAYTLGSLVFSNTNGTQYVLAGDGVSGHGITLNNDGAGATIIDTTTAAVRGCLQISKIDRNDSPLPNQSPHFADKSDAKSIGRACFYGPILNLKTPSDADPSEPRAGRLAWHDSEREQWYDARSVGNDQRFGGNEWARKDRQRNPDAHGNQQLQRVNDRRGR